jgi:NADH dehydrogenase (ubiquinone) 1 alpha/beta subcomplex 1
MLRYSRRSLGMAQPANRLMAMRPLASSSSRLLFPCLPATASSSLHTNISPISFYQPLKVRKTPTIRRTYSSIPALTEPAALERVLKVIKGFHKINPEQVSSKAHFINDLGLDSLDTVELVLAMEDEFCIEIPETEADKIQTAEDAVAYILTNPGAK